MFEVLDDGMERVRHLLIMPSYLRHLFLGLRNLSVVDGVLVPPVASAPGTVVRVLLKRDYIPWIRLDGI